MYSSLNYTCINISERITVSGISDGTMYRGEATYITLSIGWG